MTDDDGANLSYIDQVAPRHTKMSCDEEEAGGGQTVGLNSRAHAEDEGGCLRCTLQQVFQEGRSKGKAELDEVHAKEKAELVERVKHLALRLGKEVPNNALSNEALLFLKSKGYVQGKSTQRAKKA